MVPADAAPMIVGSFHGVDERRRRVAGPDRMTIEEDVRKVLLDEHAEVIREAAWRHRCPFHTQLGRALRSKPISRVLLLRRGGERLGARFPDSCSGRPMKINGPATRFDRNLGRDLGWMD